MHDKVFVRKLRRAVSVTREANSSLFALELHASSTASTDDGHSESDIFCVLCAQRRRRLGGALALANGATYKYFN